MYSKVIKRPFLYEKNSTANQEYMIAVVPAKKRANKKKKVKKSAMTE